MAGAIERLSEYIKSFKLEINNKLYRVDYFDTVINEIVDQLIDKKVIESFIKAREEEYIGYAKIELKREEEKNKILRNENIIKYCLEKANEREILQYYDCGQGYNPIVTECISKHKHKIEKIKEYNYYCPVCKIAWDNEPFTRKEHANKGD